MRDRDLRAVTGPQVLTCLDGHERDVIDVVRRAYECHARGNATLPANVYLRFADAPDNRIIAKTGYVASPFHVAGVKWVASFPANTQQGLDRASALIVLNSVENGRPEWLLEGSAINAQRTAASAALAASMLARGPVELVAFIGCGPISFATLRYLVALFGTWSRVVVFDRDEMRAESFAARARQLLPGLRIDRAATLGEATRHADLVCFATSAQTPFVSDPALFAEGAVILHISLRDLTPEVILSADNVVDDPDHVCTANTSLDLAARQTNNRAFIRCTIGELLLGDVPRVADARVTIFSPFGLAVLDLAVGQWVCTQALASGRYHRIPDFMPAGFQGDNAVGTMDAATELRSGV